MTEKSWGCTGLVCGLVTLLVAVIGGCQSLQGTIYQSSPWPLKHHTGTILDTPHYRIYTTIKDKDFYSAAVDLAEGQYRRFCQDLKREPKEKMTVYIFYDVNQWIAFTKSKFGDQADAYMRIRNGGYTADNLAAFYYLGRYPTLTIMAHELFHLYVNMMAGKEPVPAWVNEGMACYFEAHEWDVMKVVYTPRKNLFRQQNLAEAVGAKKLIPLKEILATHAGEVSKSSQMKVLTYYAQLWAMTQFMQDPTSPYHANFQKLLAELGTRDMMVKARGFAATLSGEENISFGEAVFRKYITNDLDEFEEKFNAYLPRLIGWK